MLIYKKSFVKNLNISRLLQHNHWKIKVFSTLLRQFQLQLLILACLIFRVLRMLLLNRINRMLIIQKCSKQPIQAKQFQSRSNIRKLQAYLIAKEGITSKNYQRSHKRIQIQNKSIRRTKLKNRIKIKLHLTQKQTPQKNTNIICQEDNI